MCCRPTTATTAVAPTYSPSSVPASSLSVKWNELRRAALTTAGLQGLDPDTAQGAASARDVGGGVQCDEQPGIAVEAVGVAGCEQDGAQLATQSLDGVQQALVAERMLYSTSAPAATCAASKCPNSRRVKCW